MMSKLFDNSYSGVLLISKCGKIILQRRDDKKTIINPGKLTTFGGTALPGETPIDCAIREIKEELEYDLDSDRLKELLHKQETVNKRKVNCTVYLYDDVDSSELKLNEGKAIELISVEEKLEGLSLSSLCKSVISQYLNIAT